MGLVSPDKTNDMETPMTKDELYALNRDINAETHLLRPQPLKDAMDEVGRMTIAIFDGAPDVALDDLLSAMTGVIVNERGPAYTAHFNAWSDGNKDFFTIPFQAAVRDLAKQLVINTHLLEPFGEKSPWQLLNLVGESIERNLPPRFQSETSIGKAGEIIAIFLFDQFEIDCIDYYVEAQRIMADKIGQLRGLKELSGVSGEIKRILCGLLLASNAHLETIDLKTLALLFLEIKSDFAHLSIPYQRAMTNEAFIRHFRDYPNICSN